MRPRSETIVAAAFLWKATVQHMVGIKNDNLKELSICACACMLVCIYAHVYARVNGSWPSFNCGFVMTILSLA